MGEESTAETMARCARAAETAGFESLWVVDHIAVPPDDAEGSGGRYMDPLGTLAWMSGFTHTIKLGTGVLILPYRPALPTAKMIATVQELSRERLLLGVGIGWMDPEFTALGVPRRQRGRRSDELLEFLNRAFANDVIEANGQQFLFKPRPKAPPIYVGVAYGSGLMPMGLDPVAAGELRAEYRVATDAAGKPPGEITLMTGVPTDDQAAARALIGAYRDQGIDRLVCAMRYQSAEQYEAAVEQLASAAQ
jgi:alkanesulfonate monooxygenase SsuD/methylene tetrahydromethanopterin reductase-like flavin-dependent oxidoreductase (luciferase family)